VRSGQSLGDGPSVGASPSEKDSGQYEHGDEEWAVGHRNQDEAHLDADVSQGESTWRAILSVAPALIQRSASLPDTVAEIADMKNRRPPYFATSFIEKISSAPQIRRQPGQQEVKIVEVKIVIDGELAKTGAPCGTLPQD
jgi:hypothetical protein